MLIQDIAQHLHNQGIGTLGTNLFYSTIPANVDQCIAVFDTGGMKPDTYLPTKEPTFQILIRWNSYSGGKTKLDAIRAALHQKRNQKLIPDGTYFYFIFLMAEGGHIGRDENGHDMFSINFQCRTK